MRSMFGIDEAMLRALGLLAALALAGAPACSDSTEGNGGGGGFQIGGDLNLTINPPAVTFGSVAVGSEDTRTVQLIHAGSSGSLVLRDMVLDTESAEITYTPPPTMELQPGEMTELTVTYRPVDTGDDYAVIRFDTNIAQGAGTQKFEIPVNTLAPFGQLVANPAKLDFGPVEGGTTVTRTLTVRNIGSLGVTLDGVQIKGVSATDFAVEARPDLPTSYDPNGEFTVDVSYTPTGGDVDSAQLQLTYETDGEPKELLVLLQGVEVAPRMVVFPSPIDFGQREPGVSHSLVPPVSVANQGQLPLEITSIEVEQTGDWSSTVTLNGFPAEGVTLSDSTPITLDLAFTPTEDMAVTTAPIANLKIVSNDPAGAGVTLVPVFGRPQAPSLQVNPPDIVDFGFVAQNQTSTRKVALFNGGSADLTVSSVVAADDVGAQAGEFGIKNADAWGPTAAAPTAAVIPAGEHREVQVQFTNNGGSSGVAWGLLTVESNDGQTPSWEVTLKAQRAGAPTCEVQLIPDQVDYGIVPRGFSRTLTFQLVNVGSGDCTYKGAFINDCAGWLGFGSTSCKDPNTELSNDGNSEYYKVTEEPFSAVGFIKAGQAYPIKVTFTPPSSAPLFGDDQDFAALLAVRIDHNYTADGSFVQQIWPTATGGSYPPNLHAKTGIAELSVFPQEIDFGLTTIGCHSQTLIVNAYNIGSAPLDITDWELVGCSPEFETKSYPALDESDGAGGFKKTLNPDDGLEWELVYVPQDEGGDECSLAIYTNGSDTPAAVVPILGEGTFETEHTDEYIQTSGQDVDVLFVVDNSGSMGEEQSNLSTNFSKFINEAATWNNDYHVGVITTDVEGDGGLLQGDPRYVTSSTWNAFPSNVKVGTNGSGTEQGLMAAQMALSLPLAADSTIACSSDADCTEPEQCVAGFCGGYNRAFMRKDAALEIVFVSDEDDQSPADLNFYTNFFKNLKGFYNANLLHIHAIVGPNGGCSSSSGDATAGSRYIDVAQSTGGNVISVCEPDFATGLKSIGEIAFGLKVQFFLSRVPDPATIEVKVADAACDSAGGANWFYDQPSNAVVFAENGGCMPQPGEKVWIHYDTICFLE